MDYVFVYMMLHPIAALLFDAVVIVAFAMWASWRTK